MRSYMKTLAALGFGVASLLGNAERSSAQQNSVIAIDVALKSDATMIQHAKANNARLLKAYPKGFALDATHNPHVTLLQQFVRTADLDKVYAAANKALAGENPMSWKLKATRSGRASAQSMAGGPEASCATRTTCPSPSWVMTASRYRLDCRWCKGSRTAYPNCPTRENQIARPARRREVRRQTVVEVYVVRESVHENVPKNSAPSRRGISIRGVSCAS